MQLRALEGISDVNSEKALEEAFKIMAITQETRDKIEAAMGKDLHVALFKRAFNQEKKNAGEVNDKSTKRAFIRAFEHVYGKFMLEQGGGKYQELDKNGNVVEVDLEGKDSALMKIFEKVLKFKVHPDFGLKGRSELQAVVRRLREVTVASVVGEDKKKQIEDKKVERNGANDKVADLKKTVGLLKYVDKSVNAIAEPGAKLDGFLARLTRLADLGPEAQEFLDALVQKKADLEKDRQEISDNRDKFFAEVSDMRKNLGQVVGTLQAGYSQVFKDNDLQELLAEIDGIMQNPDANNVDWQGFIEGRLKKLVKKISTGTFYKNVSDSLYTSPVVKQRIDNLVKNFKYLQGHVDDLVIFSIREEEIRLNADSIAYYTERRDTVVPDKIKKSRQQVLDELGKIVPDVEKLIGNPLLEKRVPECKEKCQAYLDKFAKIDDTTDLAAFINNTYKPFVAEMGSLKQKYNNQLVQAGAKITGIDGEIKALESYKSPSLRLKDILERAFGVQMPPEKMKRLERESREAGDKKKVLEEDHKYFSEDAAVKGLHKKYEEISGSGTTAKDVRLKEGKLKESESQREKLKKIQEQFDPDTTTALGNTFQDLEAFSSQHPKDLEKSDLESELAEQKTEVSVLDGQIKAYQAVNAKPHEKETAADLKKQRENLGKVDGLKDKLKEANKKISELEALKKFRETAKGLRTKLLAYCREYLNAYEIGIVPAGALTPDKVGEINRSLDEINIEKGFDFAKLDAAYTSLKGGFTHVFGKVKEKLKDPEFGVGIKQGVETDKAKIEKATKLHEELKPILEKIFRANELGVIFFNGSIKNLIGFTIGSPLPRETQQQADERVNAELIAKMKNDFKNIKPADKDFSAAQVAGFYQKYLEQFFKSEGERTEFLRKIEAGMVKIEKAAKEADKKLALAKEGAEKSKDLSDAAAARKIITALVAEQFPDLSILEQDKIAKMILADDVGKLMTEEGYDELARKGSADLLDTVKQVGLRGRLLGFKYQEGGKIVHPFEGLKPANFEDWPSIKRLFDIGKLNFKNGFILLAALEIFDEERNSGKDAKEKVTSIQLAGTQQKVKELLAQQLGVKDRMDEAGVRKIVDDAFKLQMEKIRPLVKTHFENHGKEWQRDGKGLKFHRIEALNLEYEELQYKFRTGEIDSEIYDLKLKALVKKAEEADVLEDVKFSQNSVLIKFWNHKHAQWIRDRGINIGKFVGFKALRAGWGATKGTGLAALNVGGKMGIRAGSFGLNFVKYPAGLLTGIGSGFLRFFRKGQGGSWWKDIKADVSKVTTPITGVQDKMVATSKGLKVFKHIGHHTAAEFAKTKFEDQKHEERDRVKKAKAHRAEKIKLHGEKGDLKPVEVAESPFIDLAEFKARVKTLNKMLGVEDAATPADTARVGAEHPATKPVETEAPAAAEVKTADHGHGH